MAPVKRQKILMGKARSVFHQPEDACISPLLYFNGREKPFLRLNEEVIGSLRPIFCSFLYKLFTKYQALPWASGHHQASTSSCLCSAMAVRLRDEPLILGIQSEQNPMSRWNLRCQRSSLRPLPVGPQDAILFASVSLCVKRPSPQSQQH